MNSFSYLAVRPEKDRAPSLEMVEWVPYILRTYKRTAKGVQKKEKREIVIINSMTINGSNKIFHTENGEILNYLQTR